MEYKKLSRRRVIASMAAAPLLTGVAKFAAAAEPEGVAARPTIKAAVLRHPQLVPSGADDVVATRARNANGMIAEIDKAMAVAGQKPRLFVFPVLQMSHSAGPLSPSGGPRGVPIDSVAVDLVSRPLAEGVFAPIVATCKRHDCYVVTSTIEKTPQFPGKYFHTGIIIGPEGLVLRSPKAQAYSTSDITPLREIADEYARAFGEAAILPVARTPIGTLGCLVEKEGEVLESARLLVSKGAEIIVQPSAEKDDVPWAAIKQATAYQCTTYMLTATVSRRIFANDPAGVWHAGAATIVSPEGKILASITGQNEGCVVSDIDLNQLAVRRQARARTIPVGRLYAGMYGAS